MSEAASANSAQLPGGWLGTTAQAHASTIAETSDGLVAAWFGGPHEGHAQVGIWVARTVEGHWSAPVEVARGADRFGRAQPCWNPVLHQAADGPLLLFYKVGPSPRRWWGMLRTSADGGRTWSAPRRLPRGILGPIKNKPAIFFARPAPSIWVGGRTWSVRRTRAQAGKSMRP